MAQNFLSCDREQAFLMPPSVRDWLPEGHLAWFVVEIVEGLDLGEIRGAYRLDGSGRAAHDPGMMVGLLVYAYSVGERSSRRIERRCVEDVAFRVIAGNRAPDHTTIARFRQRHADALAGLFVQVLALCAKAGMVRVGTVAVDGTKLRADAGLGQNRRYDSIRREIDRILAEADEVDAVEDERHGQARGDELPAELADPRTRRQRLERARRELFAEQHAEQSAARELYDAQIARREAQRAQTGRYPKGRPPNVPVVKPLERRINVTDPESRIMNSRGARIQAYNAQAVVGEGRVIIAAEVTNEANDCHQLQPLLTAARENLQQVAHPERIKCVLADGGYWDHDAIAAANRDAVVIVPTADPLRVKARERPPRQGPQADRINRILATPAGQKLYRRRAAMIEPVYAHTKHTRGIRAFSRRGLPAVTAEWKLIAATHNLLKLFRYQPQIT